MTLKSTDHEVMLHNEIKRLKSEIDNKNKPSYDSSHLEYKLDKIIELLFDIASSMKSGSSNITSNLNPNDSNKKIILETDDNIFIPKIDTDGLSARKKTTQKVVSSDLKGTLDALNKISSQNEE